MSSDEEVSMCDVLREEEEVEEQASQVLGGCDDTRCTYTQGYVKRQPLYACLSCAEEPAGVCLACSLHCHLGHDLVELYTKRDFRCDCGNARFPRQPCTLVPDKTASNQQNHYDHNFQGRYCVCDRPYPDPEADPEDMLQCVICEDWYHVSHLGCPAPENQEGWELICMQCVDKHSFLRFYEGHDPEGDVSEGPCKLKLPSKSLEYRSMFLRDGWRRGLCKCSLCVHLYRQAEVEFLLDSEDTLGSYVERGREGEQPRSQYSRALDVLSSLDRQTQLEAMAAYNEMKENLTEYLQKFVDNGTVVREEDIREFFTGLRERKRRRFEDRTEENSSLTKPSHSGT